MDDEDRRMDNFAGIECFSLPFTGVMLALCGVSLIVHELILAIAFAAFAAGMGVPASIAGIKDTKRMADQQRRKAVEEAMKWKPVDETLAEECDRLVRK